MPSTQSLKRLRGGLTKRVGLRTENSWVEGSKGLGKWVKRAGWRTEQGWVEGSKGLGGWIKGVGRRAKAGFKRLGGGLKRVRWRAQNEMGGLQKRDMF